MTSGDTLSWLNTAFAGAALVVAGAAAYVSRQGLRLEHERDAAREPVERVRQASAVSVWWVRREPDRQWGLVVSNASAGMVYDAEVAVVSLAGEGRLHPMHFVPPGRYFAAWQGSDEFDFPETMDDDDVIRPIMGTTKFRVREVTFRDGAGVRWRRAEDGTLTELPGAGPARAPGAVTAVDVREHADEESRRQP